MALLGQPAALRHKRKKPPKRLFEVESVTRRVGVERSALEIAQRLEAVALEIHIAFRNRHVAQLWPSLDVEHEEQPVYEAKALETELHRIKLVLTGEDTLFYLARLLTQLARGFITQRLDGLTNRVFQVVAHANRVLMGVFVKRLEQARARVGSQVLPVQQGRRGLERRGVL